MYLCVYVLRSFKAYLVLHITIYRNQTGRLRFYKLVEVARYALSATLADQTTSFKY